MKLQDKAMKDVCVTAKWTKFLLQVPLELAKTSPLIS